MAALKLDWRHAAQKVPKATITAPREHDKSGKKLPNSGHDHWSAKARPLIESRDVSTRAAAPRRALAQMLASGLPIGSSPIVGANRSQNRSFRVQDF